MRVHQSSSVVCEVSISHAMGTQQDCRARVAIISPTATAPALHISAPSQRVAWTDVPLAGKYSSSSSEEDLIGRRNGQGENHPEPSVGLDNVPYPDAVALSGHGRFQLGLALTCGFTFLAAALQNNLNAFILSSVHCDLKITFVEMGLLNALFLAGGICSNFMWGAVADLFGSRTVLFYGILGDGLITAVSSLSKNYITLLIFRFLNGFLVGGPSSLVFAYMGDFFTDKVRPTVICYVGIFWTLSWVIMPGVAWLVIPLTFKADWPLGLAFNSWRLLVALTAVPSLVSAALLALFPESPKFLLSKGAASEARNVLAKVYSNNSGNPSEHYPVRSLATLSVSGPAADGNPKSPCHPMTVLVRQAGLLVTPRLYRITLLACSLFFANMFGYYGLGLWLPELFGRLSMAHAANPSARLTLCAAPPSATNITGTCDPSAVDTQVFTQSLVMGVIGLTGNVMSGLLAGRLRRATLPVILTALAAVCVVLLHWSTNMTLNLVLASAFQFTIGTANLVYNSLLVDMFPPHVSGMGVCMAILSGRVGSMVSNLVFGQLLDVACSVPILLVAAVLFGGTIASCTIPNKPYSEDNENSEEHTRKEEIVMT